MPWLPSVNVFRKSEDHWQAVLLMSDEMKHHSIQPNIIIDSATIDTLENSKGQWRAVAIMLDEMKLHGILPDVINYSTAIGALEKSKGQWQTALQMLDETARLSAQRHQFSCHRFTREV